MPSRSTPWQRSLQAAESASRLLDELSVDSTRQVDVFSMCEDLGLWLTFLPLEGLLGAFVPEGSGGVIITDRRPITVQRYTAAHELGHWRLEHGHGLALDGEEFVFGSSPSERERLAQVFAANLLMPPPLVYGLLSRAGAPEGVPLDARAAYFVAREAGVSYEAAVRQLTNLNVITTPHARELLHVSPLAIKRDLGEGRRPILGYADVWPVDEAWNDEVVTVRVGDEVVVSLPENRSTGYRWMLEDEVAAVQFSEPPAVFDDTVRGLPSTAALAELVANASPTPRVPGGAVRIARAVEGDAPPSRPRELTAGMSLVGDAYLAGRGGPREPRAVRRERIAVLERSERAPAASTSAVATVPVGATGRRVLGFQFPEPGVRTLRLQHRTPYAEDGPVEEYVLHALVEPSRHGLSLDQLVDDPTEAWVHDARSRQLRGTIRDENTGDDEA